MSIVDTSISKQPFKLIEVPLNKFQHEAIPHHKQIFEHHKSVIHKLVSLSDHKQLEREVQDRKRTIQQLRSLMYELDTLRTQVEDSDLDKFDTATLSLRKTILSLISKYTELEKLALSVISANAEVEPPPEVRCYENPLAGASQIQIQEDINELKLKERQKTLNRVEALHKDIEDLHGVYTDINQMVQQQGEHVSQIENNVEEAHTNVRQGLKQIIKAAKLNRATYPLAGIVIGSLIGGPIGLIGGLKVGGIAMLGCGLAGYTGGKIVTKCNEESLAETEEAMNENKANETPDDAANNKKKDI